MQKNLSPLKQKLSSQKIDFFIQPNSDEFFFEYLPNREKRIEFLTGFSGSNATLLIGVNSSKFFTDGRYILQAKNQLDLDEFEIIDMANQSLLSWLEGNLEKSQKIAIDAKLLSVEFVEKLQKIITEKSAQLVFIKQNPIDQIWSNREAKKPSQIFRHNIEFAGACHQEKIFDLVGDMKSDALFLSNCESICWLLNIRASDVKYSPLLGAYAILYKTGEVDIFTTGKDCINDKNVNFINSEVKIRDNISSIEIDPKALNYKLYKDILDLGIAVKKAQNPILIKKAVKNKTEIKNAIKAHEIDGLALTKFLFWLENSSQNDIDELSAAQKLLEFRQENDDFLYPSFGSISGFASNGAIIHYQANEATNKKFENGSLYLIDSGGQYFQGTTDVTRTVAIGEPSAEMIHDFTLVLKGHIALAMAKFDEKIPTKNLDLLARSFLMGEGKNYAHGTGHGVGSFLSVHEGPMSISSRPSNQGLKTGMILSNEPGFYKENEYGIRIENLVLVVENKGSMAFKTLTLAPIDAKLIDEKMLNCDEKKWLFEYHKKIFYTYKDRVDGALRLYLQRICDIYENI